MKPTGLQRAAGDPFLEEFFSRIPREVAVSFSDDQLLAIKLAFAARYRGAHAIDLRISIPTPFQRIYVVLLAGLERRNAFRRRKDRAASRWRRSAISCSAPSFSAPCSWPCWARSTCSSRRWASTSCRTFRSACGMAW